MVYDEFVYNPIELEQVYNTETGRYNYRLVEVLDKDKNPVIIKRTGEIKYKQLGKADYTDKYQVCYFSPAEEHICCNHSNYCIFDEDRILLEEDYELINELKKDYGDYWNILNSIKQFGEIIYHESFDDYYDIRLEKTINNMGDVKYTTNVKLKNKRKFIEAVERRCNSIKKDIKTYSKRFKKDRSSIINK